MKIALFILIQLIHLSVLFSQNPASFPSWVFNGKNYNSLQYAVGISDPDMDSTLAFEQAKIRALVNYSMFHNSQYASLSSISIGNQQSSSYNAEGIETILFSSILKGSFAIPDSMRIVKKAISKYHEYCVLINELPDTASSSKSGNYTIIRRTGFQKENMRFLVVSDEIELKIFINDTLKSSYVLKRIKSRYDIASYIWIENKLTEIKFRDTFRNYSPMDEAGTPVYCSSLSSGLWAAFLYEISDKISFRSVLNKNNANKLIATEQGNIQNAQQINSLNNFVLSSKKFETEAINIPIKKISVRNNYLLIVLDDKNNTAKRIGKSYTRTRKSKKQLKKLKKNNWIAYGYNSVEQAFFAMKTFEQDDNYLNASAELKTQGLATGILKALEISRTDIENQLNSKIKAISQSGLNKDKSYTVQNSKSITSTKTKAISPYFIFFRKVDNQFYEIKAVLFYEMN